MSKASEWVDGVKAARGAQPDTFRKQWPRFGGSSEYHYLVAQVVEDGTVTIASRDKAIEVPGHLAADLGRWLLDTFGEEPRHD